MRTLAHDMGVFGLRGGILSVTPLAVSLLLGGCQSQDQRKADNIKAYVAAQMKDPESTRFTNLRLHLATLCGEANSKNSYGAYAGAEKFTATTSTYAPRSQYVEADNAQFVAKQPSRDFVGNFDREWAECQGKGKPVT